MQKDDRFAIAACSGSEVVEPHAADIDEFTAHVERRAREAKRGVIVT